MTTITRNNILIPVIARSNAAGSTAPWAVVFDGTTTKIFESNSATIQNLHDGAFTAEGWFKSESLPGTQAHCISKGVLGTTGWYLYYQATLLVAGAECATTDALATYGTTTMQSDETWYHLAMTWDDAGDRKVRLYVNRALVATSGVGVGAVASDAALLLSIGNYSNLDRFFDGHVGWCRVSNVVRDIAAETYTRDVPPASDANTVRLFLMDEGDGTVIGDSSTNNSPATLASGVWLRSGG